MFFYNRIPGFEPFHAGNGGQALVDMVRTKLTQSLGIYGNSDNLLTYTDIELGVLMAPLSEEGARVVEEILPPSSGALFSQIPVL